MKKELITDRLILRSFRESDLNDFFEYASVKGVGEMAGWKHHETIEESKKILDMFIAEDENYAVTDKDSGKLIGSLGIHNNTDYECFDRDKSKTKMIGYVLSRDYWGKSLIPEAVNAVIKYLFEETDIEILWVSHFSHNEQSRRVIEKCGFEYYGEGFFDTPAFGKMAEKRYLITRAHYKNSLKKSDEK